MPNPSIAYPLPNPVRRRPSRTRSLPNQYALASISETSEHDEEHRTNISAELSTEFSPKLRTSEVSLLPSAAAEGNVAPLNEQATHVQPKSVPRRYRKALKIQTTKVNWIDSDRDCGICFGSTVRPCRTKCCRNLLCEEHLIDWLNYSKLCPTCSMPCHPKTGIISLASPVIPSYYPAPEMPSAPPSSPLDALFPASLVTPNTDPNPDWPSSPTLSLSPSQSSLHHWLPSSRWESQSPLPASSSSERSYFSIESNPERPPSPFPVFCHNKSMSFQDVDPELFTQNLTKVAGKMAGRVLSMVGMVLVLHVLLQSSSMLQSESMHIE